MKRYEKEFLVNEKTFEGIARTKAWEQVNDLEKKEKIFKILFRKKIILERKLEKREKEITKLKQEVFKFKFNKDSNQASVKVKEITRRSGINLLRRLINFMEAGKEYTRSDLAEEFIMNIKDIDECLEFLEEYKLMNLKYKEHKVIRL